MNEFGGYDVCGLRVLEPCEERVSFLHIPPVCQCFIVSMVDR